MTGARREHPAPSLLAADGSPTDLGALCGILEQRAWRSRGVPSGALALQAAAADPPDVILLDPALPDLDGAEVCRRLAADPRLRDIPVLFLTAPGRRADEVRAFRAGAADYLPKPLRADEVHARVATQLELRRRLRALEEGDHHLRQVVHDLRSPLQALGAFLEMIDADTRGVVTDDTRSDIEAALEAARALREMIGSILDARRADAGDPDPERVRCDP